MQPRHEPRPTQAAGDRERLRGAACSGDEEGERGREEQERAPQLPPHLGAGLKRGRRRRSPALIEPTVAALVPLKESPTREQRKVRSGSEWSG